MARFSVLVFNLFFCCLISSNVFGISLRRIDSNILKEDPLYESALKEVFAAAFKTIYHNEWNHDFEKFTLNLFDYYIERFKTSNTMILIAAIEENALCGWVLFCYQDQQAILELICVDPTFWRKGIGKRLVFSIRDYLPAINHMTLVSRKVNTISPHFYESLGFKKTGFTMLEYDTIANELQGFEWHA